MTYQPLQSEDATLKVAPQEAATVEGLLKIVAEHAHAAAEEVRASEGYRTEPDISEAEWEARRNALRRDIAEYATRLEADTRRLDFMESRRIEALDRGVAVIHWPFDCATSIREQLDAAIQAEGGAGAK